MNHSPLTAICRGAVISALVFTAGHTLLHADFLDDVGYTQLQQALGAGTPDGSGVAVAQVEAKVSRAFLPQAGAGTFPGTGNFAGKTFTVESFDSSGGAASAHATTVAGYFYGNNTDPLIGPASVAPGVSTISCFSSGGYSFNHEYNAATDKKVHSNAWIDYSANNSLLIDFDLAVDEHGFLAVVGLNNGDSTAVPPFLASAYNGLVVGRSDGQHSSGGTPGTVFGEGRTKPELVAPYSSTSWSVGGVSSMAALLYEVASGDAALLNAYDRAEVMKAIFMAGATKDEFFPLWSRTVTTPLDAKFGAGEVNVYESYRILTAGEQAPHKKKNVALRGWDYGELGGGTKDYRITIPGGAAADEVSVILAWNRSLEGKGRNQIATVRDLNLQLLDAAGVEVDASRSMIENVEHMHLRNLPAGDYKIRVSQSGDQRGTADYALAWRVETGAGE